MSNKKSDRGFRRVTTPLFLAFIVFAYAFSASAVACMCLDADPADPHIISAEYGAVFSGFIISTERIYEPVYAESDFGLQSEGGEGYWVRSKILVLRTWRGTSPILTEVWTPVVTTCDWPPITGFYFVALVKDEKGRGVALNSYCDGPWKAEATKGRGVLTLSGMAVMAAVLCAAGLALLSLVRAVRRRRLSNQ